MRRFIITLFSIILVILQLYLSPVISIAGYAPDFVLILLAVLSARESLATLLNGRRGGSGYRSYHRGGDVYQYCGLLYRRSYMRASPLYTD